MNETIETLEEIKTYFACCRSNAPKGGKAQEMFERYMKAIDKAKSELMHMEDDGK